MDRDRSHAHRRSRPTTTADTRESSHANAEFHCATVAVADAAAIADLEKDVITAPVTARREGSIDRKLIIVETDSSAFWRASETIVEIIAM